MPIYEFHCDACDLDFETLLIRSTDKPECPNCHTDAHLHKRISVHAIGSGAPDTACGAAPCAPRPMCGSGGCCG